MIVVVACAGKDDVRQVANSLLLLRSHMHQLIAFAPKVVAFSVECLENVLNNINIVFIGGCETKIGHPRTTIPKTIMYVLVTSMHFENKPAMLLNAIKETR